MIYQVRANLFFDEQDEANDFYHDCELAWAKSDCLNPGLENFEPGTIELIENHHDDDPNEPCVVIQSEIHQPE